MALVLALSGCGLIGGDGGEGGGNGGDGSSAAPEGGFVKQGYVGKFKGDEMLAEVEVLSVERWDDSTVLTFTASNAGDEPVEMGGSLFAGGGLHDTALRSFRLLDPVGQTRYDALKDGRSVYGTDLGSMEWRPGVAYEMNVFYPPLPEDMDTVTVLGAAGLGEFAGVPVTDGAPRTFPSEEPEETPSAGDVVELPVEAPEGPVAPEDSVTGTVYSGTEEAVRSLGGEDGTETVALRTDVLFGFDEDTLDDQAQSVLEDVIEETRERADPQKPPITVTGHTDGRGTDDYNQGLSERRAEAVREVLEAELGSDYAYETQGMGSDEPLRREGGDDDAEARAENRRVEISYSFKEDLEPAESDVDEDGEVRFEGFQVDRGEAGANASFRSNVDLEPVAEGTDEETGHRIEVYPFYRDGAFLVARFDLINGEDDELNFATTGFYNRGRGAFPGFSVMDPESGVSYLQARVGDEEEDYWMIGPEPWPAAKSPGLPNHSAVYFSAPPEGVTEVTFNAGDFGLFEGVPIEE